MTVEVNHVGENRYRVMAIGRKIWVINAWLVPSALLPQVWEYHSDVRQDSRDFLCTQISMFYNYTAFNEYIQTYI